MPRPKMTETDHNCPHCHNSKLVKVTEEWEPFPEDSVGYRVRMKCGNNCGYNPVIRNDLHIIEFEKVNASYTERNLLAVG